MEISISQNLYFPWKKNSNRIFPTDFNVKVGLTWQLKKGSQGAHTIYHLMVQHLIIFLTLISSYRAKWMILVTAAQHEYMLE